MNHYRGNVCNAVKTPCFMCLNPDIDFKTIRQYEIEIEDLKHQILVLKNSDSCFRALERLYKLPPDKQPNACIKLLEEKFYLTDLEKQFKMDINDYKCQMITLTFDRHKFKELRNRQAQRNYFKYVLEKWEHTSPLYGCFELHSDGVVHTHLMTINSTQKDLDYLKSWLTNHEANIHAVHSCEKNAIDAFDYINKPKTKDENSIYNFYKNL